MPYTVSFTASGGELRLTGVVTHAEVLAAIEAGAEAA